MNYATFEGHPCRYDDGDAREAWVLFDRKDGWRHLPLVEILQFARPMTQAEFTKAFPNLPAIPSAALGAFDMTEARRFLPP